MAVNLKQMSPWSSSRPQLELLCYHPIKASGFQRSSTKRRVVCVIEDFDFKDGPMEPTKPKFIRSPYPSLAEPEKNPNSDSSEKSRRRGKRPFRKATPLQAGAGAVIGGGWSVLAFKATQQAYVHLQNHPPAHDLPLGLTNEVNQFMLTMEAGFGGLVVCMFGASSVGLGLLSIKLIAAQKTPPNVP